MADEQVFEPAAKLPSAEARERYERLVGLDAAKESLRKEAELLLAPRRLEKWSTDNHDGQVIGAVAAFSERLPLFIFAGDVGTGKTELAETFGDAVARRQKISVTVLKLSLTARGTGMVGEMTNLLSRAFREVEERVAAQRGAAEPSSAVVLVIDEADAIAQSREMAQMHHEDRAGVNAVIRGVDRFATERLPVLTVMCTNRGKAIDPAIQRRAARTFVFDRPDDAQRKEVLGRVLAGTDTAEAGLDRLVAATGAHAGRNFGYTYSDLTMRLIPDAVIDAFPDEPLRAARLLEIAERTEPTRPFGDGEG
jgi:SpoVK/Ycf46/Vps4 family AAA+-type ATPase